MTLNLQTHIAVADIEQQIAKIKEEIDSARAQEYLQAEKTFMAAQKIAVATQLKVQALLRNTSTSVAAQNRLALAKARLTEQELAVIAAAKQFNNVKKEQEASQQFTKKVAKILASRKLSKKINFSKKEKAALKVMRKSAKGKNKTAKSSSHLLTAAAIAKKGASEAPTAPLEKAPLLLEVTSGPV